MHLDPWTVLAILGMALATFACRAGGYLVFSRTRPSPFMRRTLHYIPGALFVGYVVPALAVGGVQQWVGSAVSLAVMLTLRSYIWAIAAGTAAAWAVYAYG